MSSTHPPDQLADVVADEKRGMIRPLYPADRPAIETLLQETRFFNEEEVQIALELVDVVLGRPDQQDYLIYCHESDGIVDGYYCVGPTPATIGTFDLYWIAVASARQGKGIGGSLNRHAEDLIRSMGGRLVIAETSSRPQYAPTRTFYLRTGYEEKARIQDYYKVGEDLVVYGKYLTHHHKGG